ncbi:MAG: cytochrome c biogenesis protein ResB [Rikenellaceae bacterium]
MQDKNSSKIWQAPWGYSESFAVVSGVVVVGLILQLTIGSFDFYLLANPINFYVIAALVLVSVVLGLRFKTSSFARWFSGVPFSVAIVSALLLLSVIMGITPQMTYNVTVIGFETMTSNWAFIFIYTLTIISLGALIVRKILAFKIKDISFYLNHVGLWLLLVASSLGYADIQRYIMYVNEGETQWRVYDSERNIQELPIAITLNDFSMEFYPSHRVIVEVETGKVVEGNPDDFELGEKYRAVMTAPEPRSFRSDVEVYTESGKKENAAIEVNKPLRIENWTIYQYGYDNVAGNQSTYSSFELVYDSWILPVYIGIILMMLGSVMMIFMGHKKRGADYVVE